MNEGTRVGLLGGTLDPIHVGHIDAALAAREALRLDRVVILPAHVPPHRSRPTTSPCHRFAMAALAVNGVDGLAVSDNELLSPAPSYTADTLGRLRDVHGLQPSQIFFITGADAFAEIATWRRYPEVLSLANFVVVARPGLSLVDLRGRLPELKHRMRLPPGRSDGAAPTGDTLIFLVDVPTPDVSSTEIRRRIGAGEAISGLVPAPVEDHIHRHGLYRTHYSSIFTADHLHGQN